MLSSGSPCGSRSPRVGCWTRTWRRGLIARHNDFRSNPSCRAKPWTVVCSRRSCHGGAHEHVGALDRLHMRFGNAQECVAADEGSCRRFAESRSVGQRRGPRGRSVACSLLIIEDVQSGICDSAAAAACLSSSQHALLRRSRAPRGLQASISSSLRTLAEARRAPGSLTTASPVRARLLHARSMPMCTSESARESAGLKRVEEVVQRLQAPLVTFPLTINRV